MRTEKSFMKISQKWILLWALSLSACFSDRIPRPDSTHPFSIRPEQVEELTIMSTQTHSDSPWIATLIKKQNQWEIASFSSVPNLADHRANETLVLHLLDTLSSIQVAERGPPAPLSSLGLAPPQFAIRWRTRKDTQEIKIGNSAKDHAHINITWDHEPVWLASGAFFSLLNQVQSWETLRAPSWVTEAPDDIDEIRIKRGTRPLFYAQRDGDQWGDAKHRPIRVEVDSLLNQLLQPWQKVLDLDSEMITLQELIHKRPDYSITLAGRMKTSIQLELKKINGSLYGLNRDRLGCVFIMNESQIAILKRI
jgi:hypothetical protein